MPQKQATLAVTSGDLVRRPGSCIMTDHIGKDKMKAKFGL